MTNRTKWFQIKNAAPQTDSGKPTVTEVLIYGEIDSFWGVSAGDLVRELAEITTDEILVRINSVGGDIFDGVAILNGLRGHDAKVTVQVDGLAASAASVIAMGGDVIVMNANSQMMLHNAHTFAAGDADDLQRMANMLERQNANIADIYASRAGGDVADWRSIMDDETWLTAEEAVEAGLADRVIELDPKENADAQRVAASFDLSKFRYQGRQTAPAPRVAARARTPQPTAEVVRSEERQAVSDQVSVSLDSIAELAELVGMKASDGLPAIQSRLNEVVAAAALERQRAQSGVHERWLQGEDSRLVAAAVNDGRVLAQSREKWLDALKADRETNRSLLASLTPVIPPSESVVVDAESERVHERVLASLGIRKMPRASTPPPTAAPPQSSPATPVYDDLGLPIAPQMPDLVRISRGKPRSEWTAQEREDAALWKLGPAFRAGLKPPPVGDGYYLPSPNDATEFVKGEWRPKDNYLGRI